MSGSFRYERLVTFETSVPCMYPDISMTTWTYFKGPLRSARASLRARRARVVEANPWLVGKLVIDRRGVYYIKYPERPSETDIDFIYDESSEGGFPSSASYEEQCRKVERSRAHVGTGFACLLRRRPLVKLTVRSLGEGSFVLLWSMLHVLGDGYTYYSCLNMFSEGAEIRKLDVVRRTAFSKAAFEMFGWEETMFKGSHLGFLCQTIPRTLFFNPYQKLAFKVDMAKVKSIKEKSSEQQQEPVQKGAEQRGGYVSTNDVVTAELGNLMRPRLLCVAMNLRGRVESLDRLLAGNYTANFLLDPETYCSPSLIRKSLNRGPPFKRSGGSPPKALPGLLEGTTCRFLVSTNWASLMQGLEIEGCHRGLHVAKASDTPFEVATIFSSQPGELGLVICARDGTTAARLRESSFLGEPLWQGANPVKMQGRGPKLIFWIFVPVFVLAHALVLLGVFQAVCPSYVLCAVTNCTLSP